MDEHKVAVQKMQDYIQENLYSVITIKDLAKASLYSPWYSYRLFLEYLHMTPAVYVRRMRLSKAALKLREIILELQMWLLKQALRVQMAFKGRF